MSENLYNILQALRCSRKHTGSNPRSITQTKAGRQAATGEKYELEDQQNDCI